MKKILLAALLPLLIGGCALPIPIRIASWALDGFSFLASGKSLSDHALSMVAQQDCAVWRTLKGEDVCIDDNDAILVASTENAEPAATEEGLSVVTVERDVAAATTEGPFGKSIDEREAELLANFDTAAGSPVPQRAPAPVASVTLAPLSSAVAPATPAQMLALAPPPGPKPVPAAETAIAHRPADGLFYVIGSFRTVQQATELAGRHDGVGARVVGGRVDGLDVFRVAVAFAPEQRTDVRRRLIQAGVRDMWAARMDHQWKVMGQERLARAQEAPQVASAFGS